jgi:iron(III) transport system substrate-binding protein
VFSKILLALVVAASAFAPALGQNAPPAGDAVWPYLAAMQPSQRLDVMAREAKREAQLSIYSAIGIDRAKPFIDIFKQKYPGIEVSLVRMTTNELATRLQTEARVGRTQADLMISSSDWLELVSSALAPYETTAWADLDPRFRHGGVAQGWTAIDFDSLVEVIAWRTDRVSSQDAPKTLDQLGQPKWKGRVGMPKVREQFLDAMITLYGDKTAMQKVDALAALNNRAYASIAATAEALGAGEVDMAWGVSGARAERLKASGAPVAYVIQDPPMTLNETMAVVKLGQHPYAAALFLDLMSQASTMEATDKIEPGRTFGNIKGKYAIPLSSIPNLFVYRPIPPARYRELNRIVEDKFLRN